MEFYSLANKKRHIVFIILQKGKFVYTYFLASCFWFSPSFGKLYLCMIATTRQKSPLRHFAVNLPPPPTGGCQPHFIGFKCDVLNLYLFWERVEEGQREGETDALLNISLLHYVLRQF